MDPACGHKAVLGTATNCSICAKQFSLVLRYQFLWRFDSTWTAWPLTGWLQPDNVAEFVRRNMALDNDTNSTDEWQKALPGQRQPCCGNLVGVEAEGGS